MIQRKLNITIEQVEDGWLSTVVVMGGPAGPETKKFVAVDLDEAKNDVLTYITTLLA